MILGVSNTVAGSQNLPFDLAPLGMPGCSQLVSTDVVLALRTSASGIAFLGATVPSQPSLRGVAFFAQYAVHDLGANAGNTTVSNGVKVTLGG